MLTHCPLNAPTRVTQDSDLLSTPERRHWQTCVYPGSHIAVKKKKHDVNSCQNISILIKYILFDNIIDKHLC